MEHHARAVADVTEAQRLEDLRNHDVSLLLKKAFNIKVNATLLHVGLQISQALESHHALSTILMRSATRFTRRSIVQSEPFGSDEAGIPST